MHMWESTDKINDVSDLMWVFEANLYHDFSLCSINTFGWYKLAKGTIEIWSTKTVNLILY